jgi:hypothetical protein
MATYRFFKDGIDYKCQIEFHARQCLDLINIRFAEAIFQKYHQPVKNNQPLSITWNCRPHVVVPLH